MRGSTGRLVGGFREAEGAVRLSGSTASYSSTGISLRRPTSSVGVQDVHSGSHAKSSTA
ncbi:hypothetical protein ACFT38_42755 [Streptomyces sp. NPDC056975]|uniref:hypothetical protein n=1 Tax=Streptomyces sp. NPDC056975 TaxID=3345985 RepID=UPI00363C973B